MKATIDLGGLAYDVWLRLVFDHPVCPDKKEAWYWAEEWQLSEPVTLLKHFTRLCRDFSNATSPYSPQHVDQGIWFLLGGCIELPTILTLSDIPWPPRQECLASMPLVYSSYVAPFATDVPMETCFDMWFYLIGDAVTWMPDDAEKHRVAEAAFRTLVEILKIEEPRCQHAALYGLGHLPHPRRAATIDQWLVLHGSRLDSASADWVKKCRNGTVR